ncbi:MAG: hypothetical protein K2G90_09485 [Muribaculaceae bacterium]|nr:hypothetical protein [Muribaculaceae bacterium]
MSKTENWLNRASEFHQQRMLSLAPREKLIGKVREIEDRNYMMYVNSVLDLSDEGRIYEFLIEYDIYNPSQGIYLGCKSVTLPGFAHELQIEHASADWEKIRPFALRRLNNVFVNKDFTFRLRQPDNDHNGTFWPFWISLYEDEDPRKVGCKVLDILYNVYKDFLSGRLQEKVPHIITPKILDVETAFTNEAFRDLEETVKNNIRKKTSNTVFPDMGWEMITKFLSSAESEGWFQPMVGYEKAWSIQNNFSDVDFNFIIKHLFEKIAEKLNLSRLSPPWGALIKVFMRKDETPYKSQVKTLTPSANVRKYWREKMKMLDF